MWWTVLPQPAVGVVLRGAIDWSRRFDHMQQHTGQHVLSAVLERAFGARTVSFHLGADASTIDVDRELTPSQLADGELAANRVVWDDAAVSVRYVTEDEARSLPLRKEPGRTGRLRLVEIPGVDLSACGGTHVRRTGAIGQIALVSWERFKGGQRVEFLCGGRAISKFRRLRDAAASAVRLLSVLPDDVPSAIERMQGELKEQRRELSAAQLELARYEAVSLVDSANLVAGVRLVARVAAGDAGRLKALAAAIATRSGAVALLVSESAPVLALAARAPDVALPCQDLVASLAKQFGGRGGGRPDFAQCGGLQGAPAEILAAARAFVAERLTLGM